MRLFFRLRLLNKYCFPISYAENPGDSLYAGGSASAADFTNIEGDEDDERKPSAAELAQLQLQEGGSVEGTRMQFDIGGLFDNSNLRGMNADETTLHMQPGEENRQYTFSQQSDMTEDSGVYRSLNLDELFVTLVEGGICECYEGWLNFCGASPISRQELQQRILANLGREQVTAETARNNIAASINHGYGQIHHDAAEEHGINNAALASRASDYSLLQAVADATHLTIMLFDKSSGIRLNVFTPGPDSSPPITYEDGSMLIHPTATLGAMHLSCDMTVRREDGTFRGADDDISVFTEEANSDAAEAEAERDNMSIDSMGSMMSAIVGKDGEDDSDDSDFVSDEGSTGQAESSQSSESVTPIRINHVIQDVILPKSLSEDELRALSQHFHHANINYSDDDDGVFRVTISGQPMDVQDVSAHLHRCMGGKSAAQDRVETRTRNDYTLLVHRLNPAFRENEGPWPELTRFWYEHGREDKDDAGNYLIPRVVGKTAQMRYSLTVRCSDRDDPIRIFILTRSNESKCFTQKEGIVAMDRGRLALGQEHNTGINTYDRSDLTHDQVYELLYKAGFFPREREQLPMFAERYEWFTNRISLLPDFIRGVLRLMRRFLEDNGLEVEPPRPFNPESTHLMVIFDDEYKKDLGLLNYTRVSSSGDAFVPDGFPTFHAGHNFICHNNTYFFNKHDVENKPNHFWVDATFPQGTRWYDTIGAAGRNFIDNHCQGMPCITPPRLTLHTFHPEPISPHLDVNDWENRAAWTHVSAIGAIQFHLFHGVNRLHYYGQVGAPYGDEVSLYQTAPRNHNFMNMTMWCNNNMGESEFPIPIFRAFHIKFNDPLNPSLTNCTITKYWDNFNYCPLQVVPLASI